jgi:hypothetical protein
LTVHQFFDGTSIHNALKDITVTKIKNICRPHMRWGRNVTRCALYEAISKTTCTSQMDIQSEGISYLQSGIRKYKRRKISLLNTTSNQNVVLDEPGNPSINDTIPNYESIERLHTNIFMRAPTSEVISHSISEFIDRTSNMALQVVPCGICARERSKNSTNQIGLADIPNQHHLRPLIPHSKQVLFNDMLLYPPSISQNNITTICNECLGILQQDRMPPLSLANGLWLGEIPEELSILTLPERMLIAKYFPAAYIVKLFPKKIGSRNWDPRLLQNGLRGNVSTYKLDQSQITSMIDGNLMPPPSKILAAIIGITFVGPKNLPERSMPNMFKVRRLRVRSALVWLKANNPLYSNIVISEERLEELPEDAIPEELLMTAKHSTAIDQLQAEHNGYVPDQDVDCLEDNDG